MPLLPHEGGEVLLHAPGEDGETRRLRLDGQLAALEARDVEQVVHQPDQPVGGGARVGHVALGFGGHAWRLRRQLEHPLDAGQRRAELVRDERDEIRLHLAHLPLVRHVPQSQGEPDGRPRGVLGGLSGPVDDAAGAP